MAKILVAYYSRSGVTEGLARRLAERLGADLDAVRPKAPYSGGGGALKAVWHSLRRRAPPVTFEKNPADYDLVVAGAPVWAARLAAPMRTYLKENRGLGGAWAGFWSSGSGSNYESVGQEMGGLAGRGPRASASFAEREATTEAGAAKLEAFARAIEG